ncbi:MAG: hypothetical protein NTX25_01555 [Proteobacteria bacterium]|nr:hypothetical protein [Pseudomonadota bacterium]
MDLINNIGKRLASVHKGSGIGIHAGTFNLEISTLSEIESQIESRLSESRHEILRISFADSRYGDNPIGLTQALVLSHLTMSTANHSISPVIRIGSEIIGLDKLGHFAEEGYWYFLAETSGLLQGPSERWQFGQFMEGAPDLNEELYPKYKAIYGKFCQTCVLLGGFGFYGSASTGVCSQADMQSNEDGYQFFEELHQNPDSFSFDIRNYDISKWNENISKNIYVEGLKVRP